MSKCIKISGYLNETSVSNILKWHLKKNIVKTNSLYSRCQPCSICFSFISIIKHLFKVRNCLKYLKKIIFYIVLKSCIDLSFCNTYLRNSIKYPFCNIKETLTFLIKDIWLKIRYHIRKICIWKKEFFSLLRVFMLLWHWIWQQCCKLEFDMN